VTKFESRTIRIRSANHSTTTFGTVAMAWVTQMRTAQRGGAPKRTEY